MQRKQRQLSSSFESHYSKLQKPEFEKDILGAIIADNSGHQKVKDILTASDFYSIANQLIYSRISKTIEAGIAIDFSILCEELEQAGELDAVGGKVYVHSLTADFPSTLNINHYAKIVKEYSIKRQLYKFFYESADSLLKADNGTIQNQRIAFEQIIQQNNDSHFDESFIEFAPEFLNGEDEQKEFIIPEIVPRGSLIIFAGDPRAMKTLAADEIAVAAVTNTPAFGLPRFQPARTFKVWRATQEDPRDEERKRFKSLLLGRGISEFPGTLAFSVHKGIDLDSEKWCRRIIDAIKKYGFDLVILDPIRRFSRKCDKGPSDVAELTGYLRRVIVETGVTIIVIHHVVKPPATNHDTRKKGYKISGGDWFAACECPIWFEKIGKGRSVIIPEDFKFAADPPPLSIALTQSDVSGAIQLQGQTESESNAANLALQERIIEFLQTSPSQSGSAVAKGIHANKDAVLQMLNKLFEAGTVDSAPGKKRAQLWFLTERERQAPC